MTVYVIVQYSQKPEKYIISEWRSARNVLTVCVIVYTTLLYIKVVYYILNQHKKVVYSDNCKCSSIVLSL